MSIELLPFINNLISADLEVVAGQFLTVLGGPAVIIRLCG
jgi:hypothetical protein